MSRTTSGRLVVSVLVVAMLTAACGSEQRATTSTAPMTSTAAVVTTTVPPATTGAPASSRPVDIGSVTITDSGCRLAIAEELAVGSLTITVRNETDAEAAAEVFMLKEGHLFDELVAHVEEEKRRADAGESFLGPPLASATFASPGSGIVAGGENKSVEIDAGQDGIYVIYCFRHHENVAEPFRVFALLGPLRIGDAEAALSPRGYQIMVGVNEDLGVLMAGGFTGSPPIGSFTLEDAWSFRQTDGWVNLAQNGVPILATAAAIDRQSGRVIVVGEETWTYDPDTNTWLTEHPEDQPAGALGATVAYDSGSDRVILFSTTGKTWAYDYDTNTWTEMAPSVSPSSRDFSVMTYDEESDRIILFGGYLNMNDTWAYDYDGDAWTEITAATSPPGRQYAAAAYDPATDRTILFGGEIEPSYEALGDTWAFDHNSNTWTELSPQVAPEARGRHAMAFNPADGTIVLFGGGSGNDWENRPAATWIFDPTADTWNSSS